MGFFPWASSWVHPTNGKSDVAMSVLKYAVLGSVVERPDHGYRLALRLQQRLGWENLTRQAVYLQLERLAGEGLVREAAGAPDSERGGRRKPYQATGAGVKSFDGWMRAPCALEAARDELYTKIALSKRHHLPELIEPVGCLYSIGRGFRRLPHTRG